MTRFFFPVFLCFIVMPGVKVYSQEIVVNEENEVRAAMQQLNFLKPGKVYILQPASLTAFYLKLDSLHRGLKKNVEIVHIGDSHIQAGYLPGILRRCLQRKYGNGGRGLVFPYRLAKSNGPHDYVSISNGQWKYARNVFYNDSVPIGITGFVIQSETSENQFCISLKNNEGIDYSFNNLRLFINSEVSQRISISDSSGNVAATRDTGTIGKSWQNWHFPVQVNTLCIQNAQDSNFYTAFYGIDLTNDSAGLIYHTIGVNGARYDSYLAQPLFFEQLKALHADLVIISLGTNEAISKSFNKMQFLNTVDSSIDYLRKACPGADILITTPTESCIRVRRGRYRINPNVEVIRNALIEYCMEKNLACFDLYECAGGKGSMLKYAKNRMSDKRRIHFTKGVYEMQGLMLHDALIKATIKQE